MIGLKGIFESMRSFLSVVSKAFINLKDKTYVSGPITKAVANKRKVVSLNV